MDTFYTPEEIGNKLKIHLQTVLGYIRDGKLKALKLGKGYRISESDFQEFVKSTQTATSFDEYLAKLGHTKRYKVFKKTRMKPVRPLDKKIPNKKLEEYLNNASVNNREGYRAFPFPTLSLMTENQKRFSDGLILEKETDFAPYFFFTFASNEGKIFTAESFWEDTNLSSHPENSIGLLTCIGIIYRALLFIPRYYSQIPYNKRVNFTFIIDKPMGRKLVMDSNKPKIWYREYRSSSEDPIIVEKTVKANLSIDEVKKATIELIQDFLWYFKCELKEDIVGNLIEEIAENIDI